MEREQQEVAECTFTPRVSHSRKPSSASSTAAEATEAAPVWERLHADSARTAVLRECYEEMKRRQELAACTFKPQVSPAPAAEATAAEGTPAARTRSDSKASAEQSLNRSTSRTGNIWEDLYSEAKAVKERRGASAERKESDASGQTRQRSASAARSRSRSRSHSHAHSSASATPGRAVSSPIYERYAIADVAAAVSHCPNFPPPCPTGCSKRPKTNTARSSCRRCARR